MLAIGHDNFVNTVKLCQIKISAIMFAKVDFEYLRESPI